MADPRGWLFPPVESKNTWVSLSLSLTGWAWLTCSYFQLGFAATCNICTPLFSTLLPYIPPTPLQMVHVVQSGSLKSLYASTEWSNGRKRRVANPQRCRRVARHYCCLTHKCVCQLPLNLKTVIQCEMWRWNKIDKQHFIWLSMLSHREMQTKRDTEKVISASLLIFHPTHTLGLCWPWHRHGQMSEWEQEERLCLFKHTTLHNRRQLEMREAELCIQESVYRSSKLFASLQYTVNNTFSHSTEAICLRLHHF